MRSENKSFSMGRFAGSLIGRQKGLTAVLILLVVAAAVSGLVPPLILGNVVDRLSGSSDTTMIAGTLLGAGLLYFLTIFLSRGLEAAREIVLTIWGEKLSHGVRKQLADKLSRLPASYFVTHPTGDTVSRFADDVDTLEDLFSSGVISMAADAASLIGIVIVIFTKSPGLAILLLISFPLIGLFTAKIQKKALLAQRANRAAVALANRILPETVAAQRPIRLYHGEAFMEERYDKAVSDSFKAREEANFCDAVYSPVVIITQTAITAVMMILASQEAFRPLFGISAGTAAAFIAYIAQVFTPIENIGMEIQSIQSAVAGTQRIAEFLGEEERGFERDSEQTLKTITKPAANEKTDKTTESARETAKKAQKDSEARNAYRAEDTMAVRGSVPAVEISDMSFSYDADTPVFAGFNLAVEEGESVVLTGRTGEGKSTLFKLILGLYPPTGGSVRIFGEEAASLPDCERRRLYGCVEQDFHPIAGGTILEQVTLDDPGISEADAREALNTVGLLETVEALPEGLGTKFSGGTLSAGQTQLLSIARAIATRPRLLLLDEITSDMDARTEEALMQALSRAAEGRTVLSISHRKELLKYGREVAIRKAEVI